MNHWHQLWEHQKKRILSEESKLSMNPESILARAEQRDKDLEQKALEAERAGDTESCWYAMAARAENARFLERLRNAVLGK